MLGRAQRGWFAGSIGLMAAAVLAISGCGAEDTPGPSSTADEASRGAGVELWFTHGIEIARASGSTTPTDRDAVEETLGELFDGPNSAQTADDLTASIPEDARLLAVDVARGTATVDVSPEFEIRSGLSAEIVPLAALTYTLTQFDSVDRVMLLIDGKTKRFYGTHGLEIGAPLRRSDFGTIVSRDAP